MNDYLTGRLIVATPLLQDSNFRRSVVFLIEHDGEGSLGVILNRPLGLAVEDFLPAWKSYLADPDELFEGGPVQEAIAVGIARARLSTAEGWTPVIGDVGVLDLALDPVTIAGDIVAVRVFRGYAGWGPGQLEAEIVEGAWFVIDSVPGDPFDGHPEVLWQEVLRRQPGRVALYSSYPPNPVLN